MRFNSASDQGRIPAEILSQNRHESYFQTYFQWLDSTQPDDPSARQVTIVARSPASPVIQAMRAVAAEFAARQVTVQSIFSDVDPEKALILAWEVISDLSQGREHSDLIRWARAPGILEAHEQMVLGSSMCWLGDAMRREPGRRDGFDLFDTDAPEKCSLGAQSFAAIWNFATPIPKWMLRRAEKRHSSASFAGPDPRALATLSFFRQLEKPDTVCH
jgi:hypothetical protein